MEYIKLTKSISYKLKYIRIKQGIPLRLATGESKSNINIYEKMKVKKISVATLNRILKYYGYTLGSFEKIKLTEEEIEKVKKTKHLHLLRKNHIPLDKKMAAKIKAMRVRSGKSIKVVNKDLGFDICCLENFYLRSIDKDRLNIIIDYFGLSKEEFDNMELSENDLDKIKNAKINRSSLSQSEIKQYCEGCVYHDKIEKKIPICLYPVMWDKPRDCKVENCKHKTAVKPKYFDIRKYSFMNIMNL